MLQKNIEEEDFVGRYENLYKVLEIKNVSLTFNPINKEEYMNDNFDVPINIKMDTLAGTIQYEYTISLKNEEQNEDSKDWYIEWNPGLILPNL